MFKIKDSDITTLMTIAIGHKMVLQFVVTDFDIQTATYICLL